MLFREFQSQFGAERRWQLRFRGATRRNSGIYCTVAHRGTLEPNGVWFKWSHVGDGTLFSLLLTCSLLKMLLPSAFWSKLATVSLPQHVFEVLALAFLGRPCGAQGGLLRFFGCSWGPSWVALAGPGGLQGSGCPPGVYGDSNRRAVGRQVCK